MRSSGWPGGSFGAGVAAEEAAVGFAGTVGEADVVGAVSVRGGVDVVGSVLASVGVAAVPEGDGAEAIGGEWGAGVEAVVVVALFAAGSDAGAGAGAGVMMGGATTTGGTMTGGAIAGSDVGEVPGGAAMAGAAGVGAAGRFRRKTVATTDITTRTSAPAPMSTMVLALRAWARFGMLVPAGPGAGDPAVDV